MAASQGDERRKHRRHRYRIGVELREVGGVGQAVSGVLRDISEGGLCVLTTDAVPPGRMVIVGAELGGGEPPFVARVQVRRCIETPGGHEIGLQFTWLGKDQREALDALRRFLDQRA